MFLGDTCSDSTKAMDIKTIKTNGQNVKYFSYYTEDSGNIYMMPVSKAEGNFLVNEFKAEKFIVFELNGVNLVFDTDGFTKRWNNFGGDAL